MIEYETYYAGSHWSICVFRHDYANIVVTFKIRAHVLRNVDKSNHISFLC